MLREFTAKLMIFGEKIKCNRKISCLKVGLHALSGGFVKEYRCNIVMNCEKNAKFAPNMEITAEQLASLIGGTLEGAGDVKLNNFAKIEEAGEGCITFLANPKYEHFLYATGASAVLVSRNLILRDKVDATLIRVDDPYAALAALLRHVESLKPRPRGIEEPCHIAKDVEIPDGCYVGSFAYIGRGAKIGRNVLIYPQAYIGEGVTIGDDSIIRSGVKIYEGCRIGCRCIIHSGAVIGADGFGFAPTAAGYEKLPQTGNVIIEDDVEIGANTTVDRATFGSTRVGRGTKLDNLIQIAHNVTLGENNVFAAQTGVAGSASIGSWNRIGGQVGVAGHISIGDNNEIGAQSGIPNSVGSGNRLMGYPAVDARRFAKNLVYIKKLEELFNKR